MRLLRRELLGAVWLVVAVVCAWGAAARGEPPRVVAAWPDLGETGIDPATEVLRIEFDRDMDTRGGMSLCGGGPSFPTITGRARWESPRVVLVPIALEPSHAYELSINCPAARNFRSAAGEPAEITPLVFSTGPAGGARMGLPLTEEQNAGAVRALRAAIDERYAHRDVRLVDWDALFEAHSAALRSAKTRGQFAREAARMLSAARDVHLGLRVGAARVGTFSPMQPPNCDARTLARMVPGWAAANETVTTGVFEDGVAYLMIAAWTDEEALGPALEFLERHADAPGVIIDVRTNGGGDELAARRLAACFVDEPAVYARNAYRDPAAPGGWTALLDRVIEPAEEGPRYRGPVAVLMGPACMSSNESFLQMMRTSPRAMLVGEPSYGSSGNPKPVDLGNGVTVLAPSWRDELPDGTPLEGRGVRPDIGVRARPGEFASGDPVLEAGLRAVRRERDRAAVTPED